MKALLLRASVTFAWLIGLCVGLHCLADPARAAAPAPKAMPADARILFLHHSTGECIWNGGVEAWFEAHNAANKTRYNIRQQNFPKDSPYGWENYPYDYWNIWVKNAGPRPFKQEPTLEMLTPQYEVIVFKHCFPVSNIEADTGQPDVTSKDKRLENYKLQYEALKKKLHAFPKVRFLVWTGAIQVKNDIDEASAKRAQEFFQWVRTKWDEKGDNIFLWDFYQLETEGGLYLKPAHAAGDAHPNEKFSKAVAPLLCRRIVDVIQGRGDTGSITGQDGAAPQPPKTVPDTPPSPPQPEPKTPEPPTPPTPPAKEPEPAPAVKAPTTGPGRWLFDNAEDKAAFKQRWGQGAAYAKDGDDNVVKLTFSAAQEQDWGEFGKQRVVYTQPPAKSFDLTPYKYMALRVKADREMDLVLTLLTLPDPRGRLDQSHFGFSAYPRPAVNAWKWIVLDLGKLELGAEGEAAYEKAGKPNRPMQLTLLRFVTNAKHEKATLLIDDIMFLAELPETLKPGLLSP